MNVTPLAPNLQGERNLVRGIRTTLRDGDQAMLCVAFVSAAGVNLLAEELKRLADNARLLVTTVFGSTTPEALDRAAKLGVEVRVTNPGGGTYHPKVYASRNRAAEGSVVVGSANLTAGLVTNVELATRMRGDLREQTIAEIWAWADDLWHSPKTMPWEPTGPVQHEELDAALFAALRAEVMRDPVFLTLSGGKPNRVVEATPTGLWIETEASLEKGRGPQLVPAWMIQLAWDYLNTHGSLTNKHLLASDGLNVKRSSAVCAVLARLPGVEAVKRPMGLRRRS